MWFTNEFRATSRDRLTARLLELIVSCRLRDRVRERLSAAYAPYVSVDVQREPDPFVESKIRVAGDPDRLDEIVTEVLGDLADLQANGPSADEFLAAREQLWIEINLISNEQLADVLITSALYPDQQVTELDDRFMIIQELTGADVQTLARVSFAPNQRIEIRQVPIP